ncbi:MAG: TonB-dependent receptor [Candidatus Neomarinimicrobiota bacterium]|nr:MAG: TonB-dependent receptor [Candidatus Neomarinimicrobiota bacterium]
MSCMKHIRISSCFFLVFLLSGLQAGVTGKIAGSVTDAQTGEPLIGANVQVMGLYLGAATDPDGRYTILSVPPGTYDLMVTMIGYKDTKITDVRVEIDLTTQIDVRMEVEVLEGESVTVVAQKSVVKVDVAASQTSVTSDDIRELPFTTLESVIGLKAGVSSSLSIRGGGADQTMFMLDGMVLRDERNNQPITGIPLSAVKEVSLQTGGFNAEYHNVRSGVVNVVAKEGDPDHYSATVSYKVSPPAPKHFGKSVYDPTSYWLLPYLDDSVAWTGTENGYWDPFTSRQYPQFDGWIAISEATLSDDDPTNDLTPSAAKRLFEWQHRKDGNIKQPDVNVDLGFGGPVPIVSESLGNLRFYYSFRNDQSMYLIPLNTDGVTSFSHMLKLTSDLSKKTKLSLTSLWGSMEATALSRTGGTSFISSTYGIANLVDRTGFTIPWRIFTNDYWSETRRHQLSSALNLSHVIDNKSFYEFQVKFLQRSYETGPGRYRDLEKKYEIFPGYYVDEQPFGFFEGFASSVDGGITLGGPISTSRDSSRIRTVAMKFAYTNQISDRNQLKTGLDINYDDLRLDFGAINKVLPEGNRWTRFNRYPWRLTTFIQDKFESRGLVAIMGLNWDYSNPNGKWFKADPYDKTFNTLSDDELWTSDYVVDAKPVVTVSPRLAISHPITESSKLYFNYGHYYQMPTSEVLYRIQRNSTGAISYLGDPSLPLAKTVSYELGFDQALSEMYLMHVSAYYKDVTDQQDWTRYISADGKVNYYQITHNNYQDIRGLEIELSKIRGDWFTGMVNYEYRVTSSGYFGIDQYFENPAEQKDFLRNNPYQSKPLPTPRMKGYLDFFTPPNFGPEILGQRLLGDWHLNFIGRWTAGSWFTYNPNNVRGIQYNVRWKDYKNLDLKVSKVFLFGSVSATVFMDVFNVLNLKTFSGNSFSDSYDFDYYMQSLHLPRHIGDKLGYGNIPGNDQPGDVRKEGVDFVPIVSIRSLDNVSNPYERPLYYEQTTEAYYQWVDGEWVSADQDFVDQVLKDKAYIDMPNQTYFTFLDPRDIFFGINFSINF